MKSSTPLLNTLLSTSLAFLLFSIARSIRSFYFLREPLLIVAAIAFWLYAFHDLYWKRRRLPPGPTPWLLAGNMPQVMFNGGDLDDVFQKWRRRYGAVFTFWMGPIPMVMVGEVETMKRYFIRHGDVFSGRWKNFITDTFMDGFNGVVQIDGEKWREQRRFSLHVLRDFGVGRALMEEKIMCEVDRLTKYFDSLCGPDGRSEPLELTKPISICIGNIINDILFGKTFPHDDVGFRQMQAMLDKQSKLVVNPIMGLYLTLPWTIDVPFVNGPWMQLMACRTNLWTFLDQQLQEHRRKFDPDAEACDFTYSYMKEMHERRLRGEAGHFRNEFSDKQLKMLLLDLFFAGSETTVTTAKWGILMLILHPEVQRKVHEELDQLPQRIELADRHQLTYLQATINEIQRIANILPINLLRTTMEDIDLDGFHFPAGMMVLPQVSIAMNDPENFAEPKRFMPERFIDENANLRRFEAFLPFSIGKRQCLGESLARAELFLIFANLLRNFELQLEDASKRPSTERQLGLTVSPKRYKCVIRRRCAI